MNNALDVIVNPRKEINSFDIPDNETLMAIMNSAVREVQVYLENNDILAAIDLTDKMKVLQSYFKTLYRKKKARLISANYVADGHIQALFEIGDWCNENIDHSHSKMMSKNRTSITWHDIGLSRQRGFEYIIASQNSGNYREWKKPYFNGGVEKGMELSFGKYWQVIKPKPDKPKNPEIEPSITLSPSLLAAYKATKEWKIAMRGIIEEVASGNAQRSQLIYVFNEMKDMPEILSKIKKQVGELY